MKTMWQAWVEYVRAVAVSRFERADAKPSDLDPEIRAEWRRAFFAGWRAARREAQP